MTADAAARYILDLNGLNYVPVRHISGDLTDHFDPRDNVVNLSDSVYGSSSIAALGVAAHEVGHAVQYAQGYSPMFRFPPAGWWTKSTSWLKKSWA